MNVIRLLITNSLRTLRSPRLIPRLKQSLFLIRVIQTIPCFRIAHLRCVPGGPPVQIGISQLGLVNNVRVFPYPRVPAFQ